MAATLRRTKPSDRVERDRSNGEIRQTGLTLTDFKQRIHEILGVVNIVPSRHRPYLTRRYPYRGRQKMLDTVGRSLNAPTQWTASDIPATGEFADIFAATPHVHKWQHYLPIYEKALTPYRNKPVRMLEIGVYNGGSLQMWRQYLHANAIIVGVDINPECKRFDNPTAGVHVRIGAQQDPVFLRQVADEFGPFDIILDDGSHMTSHMTDTFKWLFPNALSEGGIYIVEDLHSNYWTNQRDSPMSFVDYSKHLIDAMHAHYQTTNGELEFRVDHPSRRAAITVPAVTTMLGGVEFYDSIVLFHRSARSLPRSIHH